MSSHKKDAVSRLMPCSITQPVRNVSRDATLFRDSCLQQLKVRPSPSRSGRTAMRVTAVNQRRNVTRKVVEIKRCFSQEAIKMTRGHQTTWRFPEQTIVVFGKWSCHDDVVTGNTTSSVREPTYLTCWSPDHVITRFARAAALRAVLGEVRSLAEADHLDDLIACDNSFCDGNRRIRYGFRCGYHLDDLIACDTSFCDGNRRIRYGFTSVKVRNPGAEESLHGSTEPLKRLFMGRLYRTAVLKSLCMGRLYRTAVVTVLLLSVLSPTCQVFGVKLCGRAFLRATFLVCGMHKRSGHDATRQQDFSEQQARHILGAIVRLSPKMPDMPGQRPPLDGFREDRFELYCHQISDRQANVSVRQPDSRAAIEA
ncbi:hypothetical protein Bbelb_329010 [Branchiostoma belcheri]|nr:hypothetical protein Bbelb_329010 [Branchiostoma belcheri]